MRLLRGLLKNGTDKVGKGLPERGLQFGELLFATGRHACQELRHSFYPRRWANGAGLGTAPTPQQCDQQRPKQPRMHSQPQHAKQGPHPGREVPRRSDNTGQRCVHGGFAASPRQLGSCMLRHSIIHTDMQLRRMDVRCSWPRGGPAVAVRG